MSDFSRYLEDQLIEHIFRDTAFVQPGNVFIGLYTSATTDTGGGNECTGGAYARVSVATTNAAWTAASNGATDNVADITFPTATNALWSTITHMIISDAATNGNTLFHGTLSANKTVGSGDIFKFNVGDLDITLD